MSEAIISRLTSPIVRRLLRSEFLKYGISGVIAFVFDFGVLVVGTEVLGIHYLVSNIGSQIVGVAIAYVLNTRFVFEYRRFGDRQAQEIIYFVIIVLIGLGIGEAVLYLVTEYMRTGLHVQIWVSETTLHVDPEYTDRNYMLAKVVAVVFVFLFNFVAKKALLFRAPRHHT